MRKFSYMQDPFVCVKIKRKIRASKKLYLEKNGSFPIPGTDAVMNITSIAMKDHLIQSIRIHAILYRAGNRPLSDVYNYKQFVAMLGYDPNKASIDIKHCEFEKLGIYAFDRFDNGVTLREGDLVVIGLIPASSVEKPSDFQADSSVYEIMYIGDDIPEFDVPEDCFGLILGDE